MKKIICKRCVYPSNHPLNLIFDREGICSGCKVHDEKFRINWKKKQQKLKKIVANYKNNSDGKHDCIIPVSGARDSFFIVDYVKNILRLNPLLVNYNKHFNTIYSHKNLSKLRSIIGCSLITLTVKPQTVKKITKATIKKIGSIYWHCIAGQTVFPVKLACKLKIPLIIWGAHQGVDQVGMFSHYEEVEMTRKYRKEHDLMGYEAEDFIGYNGLTKKDLENFLYPSDDEIQKVGVRGIYLNNYIKWDSLSQHKKMKKKYKYASIKQGRTFDDFNDIDCNHYNGLHDYIKFLKHGYSKVFDHCAREIRLKKMTRSMGLRMIKKYHNVKPKDINLFLNWLGVSDKWFLKEISKFNSFKKKENLKNDLLSLSKKGSERKNYLINRGWNEQ